MAALHSPQLLLAQIRFQVAMEVERALQPIKEDMKVLARQLNNLDTEQEAIQRRIDALHGRIDVLHGCHHDSVHRLQAWHAQLSSRVNAVKSRQRGVNRALDARVTLLEQGESESEQEEEEEDVEQSQSATAARRRTGLARAVTRLV